MPELIGSVLASHPSIRSQKAQGEAAKEAVEGAKWQFFPTPSIGFEQVGTGGNDPSYNPAADKNVTTLRLQQPLWTGGRLTAGLDKANAGVVSSQATIDGTSQSETVRVSGGTVLSSDSLVFANGTVSSYALAVAAAANNPATTPYPTPNPAEKSTSPIGAAAPGATLSASVLAFSNNPAAAGQVGETFISTKPGVNLIVSGGNGIDTVYVGDGEKVDASNLGLSIDLVYFRGNWADYTKSTLSNGTKLLFTRVINGATESVTVNIGNALNYDKLIFADGAVTTNNAGSTIAINPTAPITVVPGVDPTTTTPIYTDDQVAAALAAIRDAAANNTANATTLPVTIYAVAGVSGVTAANLDAINSALNSSAIDGPAADTAPEIQAIVNAYKAVLASADGTAGNTTTPLTAAQYAAIGVTGLGGQTPAGANALSLLDNVVDGKPMTGVDTQAEVQTLADAATHVMDAAGGTPALIAALTLGELTALGVTGVTVDNLPAVLNAIGGTTDGNVDTLAKLQTVVTGAIATSTNALATIATAAQADSALSSHLAPSVFLDAGVNGVTASNVGSVDSALDSSYVTGALANTTAKVQTIVSAYNAILASADDVANTSPTVTADQYTAIGVTGVAGAGTTVPNGSALYLLDTVVDSKTMADVDTVPEVQALADAANHVIAAAGGNAAQIAALTKNDLGLLGITGVTTDNLQAVIAAIGAVTSDAMVDTPSEIQSVVNAAAIAATNNLTLIGNAAEANNAVSTGLGADVYAGAGVTGVNASNLVSMDLALDSAPVTRASVTTATAVQTLVNAYNAILASANGVVDATLALTGAQYTAIGVTGVSGLSASGNAMHLLDDVVDGKNRVDVDGVVEVQALADAANHVMNAAGGTGAQVATLTQNDLVTLGVTGVTALNFAAVQAGIAGQASDVNVDTLAKLQGIVTTAINSSGSALTTISTAAGANNAASTLTASIYAQAGVSGVSAGNLSAINSALDSAVVDSAATNTVPKVQAIVDAYNAILASADGTAGNTTTPLSAAQYGVIGVSGLTGQATGGGTALSLLDNVVDGKPMAAMDTEAEVQTLADAANHVMDAAGGTAAQIAALTQSDLVALGVTGITTDNLPAVLNAIAGSTDANVDTLAKLQALVTTATTNANNALSVIAAAAGANNASDTLTPASVYAAAGITGVTSSNQAAINSALNSSYVTSTLADTTAEVQTIVNGYLAILASADGVAGNTATPLTFAQYTNVGVTGLTGQTGAGTGLNLLDSVVDGKSMAAVDTVPELQQLADAANHVLTAAGGLPSQATLVTLNDLTALGVSGVTVDNLASVQGAISAAADASVDTLPELQAIVTTAITSGTNALTTIGNAAQANTAGPSTTPLSIYQAAGVMGVDANNLAAINSALNSTAIDRVATNTTAKVQAIVDAYNAILNSADGALGNTSPALTDAQYSAIGVTGLAGQASTGGTALTLLDNVVDGKAMTAVDTEAEVQTLADAANHVMGAAGGTATQIAALTQSDLVALGVTGITADNLPAVLNAIGAATDANVDTLAKLQSLVTTAENNAGNALAIITAAAGANNASDSLTPASVYVSAGVSGVTNNNQAAINSALNSSYVTSALTDTTAEVQGIANAYNAILTSADVSGVNANNLCWVQTALRHVTNDANVDTRTELQALVNGHVCDVYYPWNYCASVL